MSEPIFIMYACMHDTHLIGKAYNRIFDFHFCLRDNYGQLCFPIHFYVES